MKKLKYVCSIIILLLLSCNDNNQKIILGSGINGLAIIEGNLVKQYVYYENFGWREIKEYEFSLPNKYKNVFIFQLSGFALIVGNKLNFYTYYNNDWNENQERQFTLPRNYKNIFVHNTGKFSIIIDNIIKHFVFYDNNWNELDEYQFALPNNYKYVFIHYMLDYEELAIVVSNSVKYYKYDNGWQEMKNKYFTYEK